MNPGGEPDDRADAHRARRVPRLVPARRLVCRLRRRTRPCARRSGAASSRRSAAARLSKRRTSTTRSRGRYGCATTEDRSGSTVGAHGCAPASDAIRVHRRGARQREKTRKSPSRVTSRLKRTRKSPSRVTSRLKKTRKSPSRVTSRLKKTRKSPSRVTCADFSSQMADLGFIPTRRSIELLRHQVVDPGWTSWRLFFSLRGSRRAEDPMLRGRPIGGHRRREALRACGRSRSRRSARSKKSSLSPFTEALRRADRLRRWRQGLPRRC